MTAVTSMYTAQDSDTYCFRVLARDVAGNEEVWPDDPNTCTRVGNTGPSPRTPTEESAVHTDDTLFLCA